MHLLCTALGESRPAATPLATPHEPRQAWTYLAARAEPACGNETTSRVEHWFRRPAGGGLRRSDRFAPTATRRRAAWHAALVDIHRSWGRPSSCQSGRRPPAPQAGLNRAPRAPRPSWAADAGRPSRPTAHSQPPQSQPGSLHLQRRRLAMTSATTNRVLNLHRLGPEAGQQARQPYEARGSAPAPQSAHGGQPADKRPQP